MQTDSGGKIPGWLEKKVIEKAFNGSFLASSNHNDDTQDTQCETAGKLSQSIYVVESLLGKCHEENDLLFFTIRPDSGLEGGGSGGLTAGSGSSSRRNSWFKVPKFITGGGGGGGGGDGATRAPTVGLTFEIGGVLKM